MPEITMPSNQPPSTISIAMPATMREAMSGSLLTMVEFENVMFSKPPCVAVPILKPLVLLVMMQLVTAMFLRKLGRVAVRDSRSSGRSHRRRCRSGNRR